MIIVIMLTIIVIIMVNIITIIYRNVKAIQSNFKIQFLLVSNLKYYYSVCQLFYLLIVLSNV